jgi:hypothetical protein
MQSRRYPAKLLGKPTPETHAHAEDMIIRRIRHLYGELDVIMQQKKSMYVGKRAQEMSADGVIFRYMIGGTLMNNPRHFWSLIRLHA